MNTDNNYLYLSLKLLMTRMKSSTNVYNHIRLLFLSIAALSVFTSPASFAHHSIYSPSVEYGEVELELKGHVLNDPNPAVDGEQIILLETGYGFTDKFFASFIIEFEKEPSAAMEAEAAAVEAIYLLTEPGQYWLDVGLYGEAEFGLEAEYPDLIEFKLLIERQSGKYLHTLNLIAEREYGNNAEDETEFEYAWRTKYRLQQSLEPALEVYGNFEGGEQKQVRVGYVLTGEFPTDAGKFKYEAGILAGVTDVTPDTTFKWMLEYEFRLD